jgi:2,4-dienoyl-CoA reductase-like NADH-dependent reductase (Old Yellow Enzyme family)
MSDAVHETGALMIVQVFHAGMRADDTLIPGPARSCVDTVYKHRGGTRSVIALTEEEIEQLIQDFVLAAKRVEQAGCDGIEIHGAHGYILTQFLCPELNTRTDQWGGPSLENRARLTRRVIQGIRDAVDNEKFIIGIRLSPEPGYETAGWMMDPDENIQVAKVRRSCW